jgi:hypothetical protein
MFCKWRFQRIGPTQEMKGSDPAIKWPALLLHGWEVRGSSFSPDTGCSVWFFFFFFWLSLILQADARIMPQISHEHFLPISVLCCKSPTIWLFVAWSIDSIVKITVSEINMRREFFSYSLDFCRLRTDAAALWSVFNAKSSRMQSDGQIQEWYKKMSLNAIWNINSLSVVSGVWSATLGPAKG